MATRKTFLVSFGLLAALALAGPADAADSCGREARILFRDCSAACIEVHQVDKDACLNRDHACVETCRVQRAACSDDSGLQEDLAGCAADLDEERLRCRSTTSPDTVERDACIDAAQVVAFQCRDAAREAGIPLLKLCRSDFRACAKACGPPDPLDPINVRQCRLDAALAHKACKAVCIEDFQLGKDCCKNRDHACVETCRGTRRACAEPIVSVLEEALDVCNATRDAGVAGCKALYAEETPERDACIDPIQVVAFQCRDAAREVARPGLVACRQGFRDCAQACPPPAP